MIDGIPDYLRQDFDRIYKNVNDTNFQSRDLISFYDVLKAHYLIADYFIQEGEIVTYGVKDINILGSALGRQITGYGDYQKWNKPLEICATLFYGLVKNHAFHDANKRTALLVLLYQLYKFGKTIDAKQKEFEDLAVNVALDNYGVYKRYKKYKHSNDSEVLFIADFLRRHTRDIDKKFYKVTYQELNTLLKKHNYYISDAQGNFANVIKLRQEKSFLGLGSKIKEVKVIQIGFPGWKKTVNLKALKEVLKAAELTEQFGIDSHAFFNNAAPLNSLIDCYRGPLKRLRDR